MLEDITACNRIPFLSDSSCDRGSVDILAFENLPICNTLTPSVAKIAPPKIDYPVFPFTPPPCSCINITLGDKSGGILEDREDVHVKWDFAAVGDCCAGNYEATINVAVPCIPFTIQGGSDPVPVTINTVSCWEQPSGTLSLGMTVEECEIVFNPTLELDIPRPREQIFDTEFIIDRVRFDEYDERLNRSWVTEEVDPEDSCVTLITNHTYLQLPVPPKYIFTSEVLMDTGCSVIEPSVLVWFDSSSPSDSNSSETASSNSDEVIKYVNMHMDIKLPKITNLTVGADTEVVITDSAKNKLKNAEGTLDMQVEEDSCGFATFINPKLELALPCPIVGTNYVVNANIRWARLSEDADKAYGVDTARIAYRADDDCQIVADTTEEGPLLDVVLPCPLDQLTLLGDKPNPERPYIKVSKDPAITCDTTWRINLVLPGYMGSSSSSSDSSDSSYFGPGSGSADSSAASTSQDSDEIPSFDVVTDVACNTAGGLTVTKQRVYVDFKNQRIITGDIPLNAQARGVPGDEQLAQNLLKAAVKAIADDPSILALVDNPGSIEADAAMVKLGFRSPLSVDSTIDDEQITDIL